MKAFKPSKQNKYHLLMITCLMFIFSFSHLAVAAKKIRTYTWKDIKIKYDSNWRIHRDENFESSRMLALYVPKAEKHYPISIMLTLLPLTKTIRNALRRSKNMREVAIQFALPYLSKLTQSKKRENVKIAYNSIAVADKLAAGALLIGTTQHGKYVGIQSFALRHDGYLFMGMIVSQTINNIKTKYHNRLSNYTSQAYDIVDSIHIDH